MEATHIFGLNHFLQNVEPLCGTPAGRADETEQKAELQALLEKAISENHPQLIAEEAHPRRRNLGAALAERFGTTYIDITMPVAEREKVGIRTPQYNLNHASRAQAYREFERYMFQQTANRDPNVSLVMCGRCHMRGLEQRFREAGVDVSVYDVFDFDWYRGVPVEDGVRVVGYDNEADFIRN